MRTFALCGLCCFAVSSCATIDSLPATPGKVEIVEEKNYNLGVFRSAFVCEDVIRIKNYKLVKSQLSFVQANENFFYQAPFISISIYSGEKLPIVGSKLKNGKMYYVAQSGDYGILVSEDGILYPKVINGLLTGVKNEVIYSFRANPISGRLRPIILMDTDKTALNQNYEIIYNGVDSQAIHLQYREYTSDDLAKPAFFQELSYPVNSEYIRFRNLKISIKSTSSEKIEYCVVSER